MINYSAFVTSVKKKLYELFKKGVYPMANLELFSTVSKMNRDSISYNVYVSTMASDAPVSGVAKKSTNMLLKYRIKKG